MKDGFERREALIREQEKVRLDIDALDKKLSDLKFLYDQYFIGFEKIEPWKLRDEVTDLIKKLSKTYIKTTAIRFKLNALIARHGSYSKLWDRILREIEEGTYKRDLFRIKVKEWQHEKKEEREEVRKEREKKTQDPVSILFKQYIDTRKQNNEPVDTVNQDKFRDTITKQVAEIRKKFNCKSVSFKITVENGKTKLKAVPKN